MQAQCRAPDRRLRQPAKTSMKKGSRQDRTRPQGGCTHRYPNCYAKAAAGSARWRRNLRYQTVGREPARPWCLFLLRMHIEHSSTTPLASKYGAPVFHQLTVPSGAPATPLASFFCTAMRCGVHRRARCATLNQYFQCRCASAADRRITDSQSTAAYQTGGLHGI